MFLQKFINETVLECYFSLFILLKWEKIILVWVFFVWVFDIYKNASNAYSN